MKLLCDVQKGRLNVDKFCPVRRADSVYKTMPQCDVWEIERDARNWRSGNPCIGSSTLPRWGRLRQLWLPASDEMDLARFAVRMVRRMAVFWSIQKVLQLWEDPKTPFTWTPSISMAGGHCRYFNIGSATKQRRRLGFTSLVSLLKMSLVGLSPWVCDSRYSFPDKSRLEVTKRERELHRHC